MNKTENGLDKCDINGGKRAHLRPADDSDWDCWVGYGKSEGCDLEGPWLHMAIMAAKILRHANTAIVAPNLHRPDLELTKEQEENY